MKKIKNIIFDFGGVLYRIDFNRTIKAFKDISYTPELLTKLSKEDILKISADYETGNISSEVFFDDLINSFNLFNDRKLVTEAWNRLLIEPFSDAVNTLNRLSDEFNLYLFSNTNESHFKKFYPQSIDIFNSVDKYFLSYKMGLRKPEIESFYYVIDELKILPQETIFIDDSIENVKSAEKCGLKSIYFINQNLSDLLHTIQKY